MTHLEIKGTLVYLEMQFWSHSVISCVGHSQHHCAILCHLTDMTTQRTTTSIFKKKEEQVKHIFGEFYYFFDKYIWRFSISGNILSKDTFTANSFLQRDRKYEKSSGDMMELPTSICAQERLRVHLIIIIKFITAMQKSVIANGTFFNIWIIMIHGVNYSFRIKAHKHYSFFFLFFAKTLVPLVSKTVQTTG